MSYLSTDTVTFINALESVAVNIEQTVIPVIIHTTENSLPLIDFGVLSPYLDLKETIKLTHSLTESNPKVLFKHTHCSLLDRLMKFFPAKLSIDII